MTRTSRMVLLGGSVLTVAMTGSISLLGKGHTQDTWPVLRSPKPGLYSNVATTPGGAEARIKIEIVPDAVNVVGAKESIQYHAELSSRLSSSGAIAWSVVIVDDLGQLVSTLDRGQTIISPNSNAKTAAVVADLPDGFYTLLVRGALHSPDWDDATEARQPLAVVGGKTREISFEEWFARSRAGQAVLAKSAAGAP